VSRNMLSTVPTRMAPLHGLTTTHRRTISPTADWSVKLIVIRDGSAILSGDFGQRPVNVGDAALLGANVPCGAEPEGRITVTAVYLDPDYAIDSFYWQHAGVLLDRLEAQEVAATVFVEPVQVLRIGEHRLGQVGPWLDELAELSQVGNPAESFARMQVLWFSLADVIRPFIKAVPVEEVLSKWVRHRPASFGKRRFAPVRAEAEAIHEALRSNPAKRWRPDEPRRMVRLSEKQATHVFVAAYGKTPHAYLMRLRVEWMARLLRESNLTVAAIGRRVGWRSRNRSVDAFREHVGMTPSVYRARYTRIEKPPLSTRRTSDKADSQTRKRI
jgi:AraC family transcriptional regulator